MDHLNEEIRDLEKTVEVLEKERIELNNLVKVNWNKTVAAERLLSQRLKKRRELFRKK